MIITSEGVEYLIETPRYHYFECKGTTLFPKSISFKAKFSGSSYIQDLRFVDWLGMLLNNKIVIASDKMPLEEDAHYLEKVSPLADPYLTVIDTSGEYLTKTLFTIINSLLPVDSKIQSLEWNN